MRQDPGLHGARQKVTIPDKKFIESPILFVK